jgi:hypothetical protein
VIQHKDNKALRIENPLEQSRQRILAEAMALESGRVRRYNLDAPMVAALVRSRWPLIEPLLPTIRAMPGCDAKRLELLPAAVDALQLVDGRIPRKVAVAPSRMAEAVELRRWLVSAARILVDRGLLDGAIIERASRGTGFLAVANGLTMLATELTAKWSRIVDRTVVTTREIEEAQRLGYALLGRAMPTADNDDLANLDEERARIATLVVDGWAELRAALGWLRRDRGDVNDLAPSLFARGGGRRARGEAKDESPSTDESLSAE